MMSSGLVIFVGLRIDFNPARLLLYARLAADMFRRMMRIPKIQISEINWKRQDALQNPDRIVPIDGEIGQQEKRAGSAAFPKAERNHTFTSALGGDPLNEKA